MRIVLFILAAAVVVVASTATAYLVFDDHDGAAAAVDVCDGGGWPPKPVCLHPGSALTFRYPDPGGPYYVLTPGGMTTLDGHPVAIGPGGVGVRKLRATRTTLPNGQVFLVPSTDPVPAKVPLTLTPVPRRPGVFSASWPVSAHATGYRIWQDGIVAGVTALTRVYVAFPCGKRTRSNVGPVNAAGAAPLAPPVYTDVPPC